MKGLNGIVSINAAAILSFMPHTRAWMSNVPMKSRASPLRATVAPAGVEKVAFAKYEGLGNDFILVDDRSREDPSLTPEQSEKLCDRNFGIGGDGVIFALAPPKGEFCLKSMFFV